MSRIKFSEDEYDLFTELINVSMGLSAADLAKLFNQFVELEVPTITIESSEYIPDTIVKNSLFSETELVTIIKQKFDNNSLKGEGAIILNQDTKEAILPLLGLTKEDFGSDGIKDFLLELSSLLVGSCLSNLFNQFFDFPIKFEPPSIVAEDQPLRKIAYEGFEYNYQSFEDILCSKINFVINHVNFQCDLFFFVNTESLSFLQNALKKILKESF
jgi:chemotaxis protein CheY-P-specific phosphatase CheC